MPPSAKAVKLATKATSTQLAKVVSSTYESSSRTFYIQVLHSRNLKHSQRDAIWSIWETNMADLYKASSFGWDPEAKRKELFHSLARFILISEADKTDLVAFTHFRFEAEEGEYIIYCYDLQVSPSMQGTGLGKNMMKDLEKLGQKYEMEKIVLTVFKTNVKAAGFYKAFGFEMDPSSPNFIEEGEDPDKIEDVDYEILSKPIPPKLSTE